LLAYAVALVPFGIWCTLLLGRGKFWVVRDQLHPRALPPITGQPRIVVVIPARDEERTIGGTVRSLLRQDVPPATILVVDDNSSDRTAETARRAAAEEEQSERLEVISGRDLIPGWTGKLWALSQGVERAAELSPDFLLFTDADIVHQPDSLAKLISLAQHGEFDLVSFMVRLSCETTPEKLLIPPFVFFFLLLYPPAWIRSSRHRTAGAAGGCVLIRPLALGRAGGLEAIRSQVIDDCALARVVKRSGGRISLNLTNSASSERRYETWGELEDMIARTAFNQLRHSALLLFATLAGLFVTYLLPVGLLFSGRLSLAMAGLAALLCMCLAYAPINRFYRNSPAWVVTLPIAATFYGWATLQSAIRYWRGSGGNWKGRVQDQLH
jgi:hopene-associated glycosyltransferase HpnB